jgi:hypothetical protein
MTSALCGSKPTQPNLISPAVPGQTAIVTQRVWVVSSYDGDLVLVPADRLDQACEVLQAAGHQVRGDRDAGGGRRAAS